MAEEVKVQKEVKVHKEAKLADFFNNETLSDITIVNPNTNAQYKYNIYSFIFY